MPIETERSYRAKLARQRRAERSGAPSFVAPVARATKRIRQRPGENLPEAYLGGPPVLNIDISDPANQTKQVFVKFPGGQVNIERDLRDRYDREMTRIAVEAEGETPSGTWLFNGRATGSLQRVLSIIRPLYGEPS